MRFLNFAALVILTGCSKNKVEVPQGNPGVDVPQQSGAPGNNVPGVQVPQQSGAPTVHQHRNSGKKHRHSTKESVSVDPGRPSVEESRAELVHVEARLEVERKNYVQQLADLEAVRKKTVHEALAAIDQKHYDVQDEIGEVLAQKTAMEKSSLPNKYQEMGRLDESVAQLQKVLRKVIDERLQTEKRLIDDFNRQRDKIIAEHNSVEAELNRKRANLLTHA